MTTLLDTSALAKLVVVEKESAPLRRFLKDAASQGHRFYISSLAVTELRRLVIRLGLDQTVAEPVLARFGVVRLGDGVLHLAGRLPYRHLGTLDAIHLATALTIEASTVVTYDLRQAEAARTEGLTVVTPM